MDRRSFLTTAVLGAVSVGGCVSAGPEGQATSPAETSDPTPSENTDPTPSATPAGTESKPPDSTSSSTPSVEPSKRGIPIVPIAEIVANPVGTDGSNLDGETVRLEFAGDVESFDLAGFTLTYEPSGHTHEFSDFVSGDMRRGTTVEVHSGDGERGVDGSSPPEYSLSVGSSDPLLPNDGGTLTLRNPDGSAISEVTYPALAEGETYVVQDSQRAVPGE